MVSGRHTWIIFFVDSILQRNGFLSHSTPSIDFENEFYVEDFCESSKILKSWTFSSAWDV